jgi:hypothetical protein
MSEAKVVDIGAAEERPYNWTFLSEGVECDQWRAAIPIMIAEECGTRYVLSLRCRAGRNDAFGVEQAIGVGIAMLDGESGRDHARDVMRAWLRSESDFIVHVYDEHGEVKAYAHPGATAIEEFVDDMAGKPGTRVLVSDWQLMRLLVDNGDTWDPPHRALMRAIQDQEEAERQKK